MKLLVPDEFSYIGMDEISVENMIVTRLEHSKKCQNTDYYAFGTKKSTKELPDTHTEVEDLRKAEYEFLQAAHVPVRRRSLGSNYTFLVQSNQFDFYRYKEDEKTGNPWIFDVRMAGKGWRWAIWVGGEGDGAWQLHPSRVLESGTGQLNRDLQVPIRWPGTHVHWTNREIRKFR